MVAEYRGRDTQLLGDFNERHRGAVGLDVSRYRAADQDPGREQHCIYWIQLQSALDLRGQVLDVGAHAAMVVQTAGAVGVRRAVSYSIVVREGPLRQPLRSIWP